MNMKSNIIKKTVTPHRGVSIILFFLLGSIFIQQSFAQNIKWKRNETITTHLELFHSTYVINLPTAETMQAGDFEFNISHRFVPALSEGYKEFWGLDGPANIRLALGYAPTNKMVITLGRTNVNNNLDLQFRYKFLKLNSDFIPLLGTLNLGGAWNSYISDRSNGDPRNFQYFAQFIFNTLLFEKLGIGFVPSYLYNSDIFLEEIKRSLTMGLYAQYYFSEFWSLMVEWNPTTNGWRDSFNSFSTGIELETGGHFFKIFISNNTKINYSQFLAGADKKFAKGGIRLGFMITRLL